MMRAGPYQKESVMDMDVSVWALRLPIVLSAVAVFIVAFIAHRLVGHHKGDWKKIPSEDAFLEAVRSQNIEPGQYMFPRCDIADMKDPEKKQRYQAGPHGVTVVWPGVPNMFRQLGLTFIFYVLVGVFVGYIGSLALHVGAEYMSVFRVTGTAAIMAYCLGTIPGTIWFSGAWKTQLMYIIDGIVYGLVTAGFFGWLWPKAEMAAPALPAVGG
jgi:hypothetical protein